MLLAFLCGSQIQCLYIPSSRLSGDSGIESPSLPKLLLGGFPIEIKKQNEISYCLLLSYFHKIEL